MRVEDEDLQRFLAEVQTRYGLVFDPSRYAELRELIAERAHSSGSSSIAHYLGSLKATHEEWNEITSRLTVPETYFFRIAEQFEAFSSVAVPKRLQARASERTLRLASLGCASGEEPYTMAMILRTRFPELSSWEVQITGFDLSRKALQRARRAVYTEWSLRATPEEMRRQFFRQTKHGWEVNEDIRKIVRFEPLNILDLCDFPSASFDIAFFRNVLIYFSRDSARAAVKCVAQMLVPGGYFFIGTAETLRGISNDFSLCHTHDAFYYRREPGGSPPVQATFAGRLSVKGKMSEEGEAGRSESRSQKPADENAAHPFQPIASTSWVDEIRNSSLRVADLTAEQPAVEKKLGPSREDIIQAALASIAEEQYVQALQILDSLATHAPQDADVQVLRAVLLTNSGSIDEAEAAVSTALKFDHLNAGAHYLLAVCDEQRGELAAALEHDAMAAYLDPAFAMAHVHAAGLHRRLGNIEAACEAIERAKTLLANEDATRIQLFGGGFKREALIAYCDRELSRCRSRQ